MNVLYKRVMTKQTDAVTAGRPREFDTHEALANAITQFSAHGYHGTSIADLNKALGLTTGSIYKAWGDKHGLLMAALDRYIETRLQVLQQAVGSASTALEKITAALRLYAESSSGRSGEIGCLVVEMAMELWQSDAQVAARLAKHEENRRAQFIRWLREGQEDGSLRNTGDVEATADLLLALTQGMRVLGKSAAPLERMQAMADQTVAMLASGAKDEKRPA
ncbi:TetR/AcrR family transcriptional regulator [Rhizobium oryzicola]|uniref:TetR/AcrR family transcriptional regulator n=1 Tax=Rhizobium oryzicola TaxID=1232668 RepID=A0ABT8SU46_9HYPH|nr:TetR/AcrR family transcriptional regulator [Rhizobium oryzicola]MDO1581272.1 TetR/AcrR family transcriptional regulator [Rhizobium oryzicola]